MKAIERRIADLWFTEYQTPNLRLGLRIEDVLLNKQSKYQHILVVDTKQYGRVWSWMAPSSLPKRMSFVITR